MYPTGILCLFQVFVHQLYQPPTPPPLLLAPLPSQHELSPQFQPTSSPSGFAVVETVPQHVQCPGHVTEHRVCPAIFPFRVGLQSDRLTAFLFCHKVWYPECLILISFARLVLCVVTHHVRLTVMLFNILSWHFRILVLNFPYVLV